MHFTLKLTHNLHGFHFSYNFDGLYALYKWNKGLSWRDFQSALVFMSWFRLHSVHVALNWHMSGLSFLKWFDHLIDLENKRYLGVIEREPAGRTSIPEAEIHHENKKIISKISWQSFGDCKMEILQENFPKVPFSRALFSRAALRLLGQLRSQSKFCVYGSVKMRNKEPENYQISPALSATTGMLWAGDRSCTWPWLTWGHNPRAWITFPATPAASGAAGMMEHTLTSVPHKISLSVPIRNKPPQCLSPAWAPNLTAIPPAVTPLGGCCSTQAAQGSQQCPPGMRSYFYLSSWEFFPDLLLFLASRGDERIFLDGGPESLP